jgi:hypothetical protein
MVVVYKERPCGELIPGPRDLNARKEVSETRRKEWNALRTFVCRDMEQEEEGVSS